jgi:hypothetical protein
MPQAPARRDTSKSSAVATLVTLHHRRRGWAWVGIGSLIGLVVYAGIDVRLFENLTGTPGILSAIPVFVLLALFLAGLVVVIADTSRIHRADAGVRVTAKNSVSHYPIYAHAHSYPPRHHGSWVFAIIMLVGMTSIAVFLLPAQVNAWGFVAGAESQDTFNPVSYGESCTGLTRSGGCHPVTEGYLSKTGARVNWGGMVPLAQPFRVRDPLWPWGTGRALTSDDGSAIASIIGGLFFDGVALVLLYAVVVIVRGTESRQRQRMVVPAGAHPGRARQAHHPDRGHQGSDVHHRARRRRGRR